MSPEQPPDGAREAASKRRVLVVDDNEDSADLLVQLLELQGHEARTAYTARDAFAIAREFLPQVAILDSGLPDMPGYELAALFRASEPLRGCKLIAVTGYSANAEGLRTKMADFDLHLVKPVDLQGLTRAVSETTPAQS